jgi:hypothetical protein
MTDEMMRTLDEIEERFDSDTAPLSDAWKDLLEARKRHENDQRISKLSRFVDSMRMLCQQALYSKEQLAAFEALAASLPSSPPVQYMRSLYPYQFFVANYLYDFMARIKTAVDLLALTVNHIYDLKLDRKACRLEKGGQLASALTSAYYKSGCKDQHLRKLGAKLDRERNEWFQYFYEARNLIIHREGLQPIRMVALPDPGLRPIQIQSDKLLQIADEDEREHLRDFFAKIDGQIITQYQTVDPVMLCEVLWNRLAALIRVVFQECRGEIASFISGTASTMQNGDA